MSLNSIFGDALSSVGGALGDVVESVGDFAGDALGSISNAAMDYLDAAGNVWVDGVTSSMQFEQGANANMTPDAPASNDNAGNISSNSHASIKNGLSTGVTVGLAVAGTITVLAGIVLISGRGGK